MRAVIVCACPRRARFGSSSFVSTYGPQPRQWTLDQICARIVCPLHPQRRGGCVWHGTGVPNGPSWPDKPSSRYAYEYFAMAPYLASLLLFSSRSGDMTRLSRACRTRISTALTCAVVHQAWTLNLWVESRGGRLGDACAANRRPPSSYRELTRIHIATYLVFEKGVLVHIAGNPLSVIHFTSIACIFSPSAFAAKGMIGRKGI